jgi:catechol 2,3-dioxygenase-like lactoylglutathione lyase family enzyme
MLTERRVHPTIPVADRERARAWYEERLGFRPVWERPQGIMYEAAGGSRFVLFPSANAGTSPGTLMSFEVPDIEAEVAELKARGVVFEEYDYPNLRTVDSVATMGEVRAAWFKDSEGNVIGVVQFPPD